MLCCERCEKHMDCVKKWMLGEKGMPQTCCFECHNFSECFGENMKKRWEILHGEEQWRADIPVCQLMQRETEGSN
ncbi:hypothetical protein AUJ95_06105 [Candidatus Desantisbacteria bacterium CG2_30_40_21]|uniref:Uncharacterized protein n=1 Tax=Candidatus Desantisbacteria bacterium CG2_30_40_21 TaxID=1817895 RepID=A0A1J5DSF7_9BACT|nr:MAG: hypothetical protein AUJ95_06105 [Candidatus Desantisbacteria bacterium CG2_30_40_21]